MKSILVPTDFSSCAQYAFDVASQLAKRFGARLHLLHCLNIPANWNEMSPAEKEKLTKAQQLVYNADVLYADLKQQHPDLDMTFNYCGGRLVDGVEKFVDRYGVDFIVMGSHGTSGKNEYFIGSNTQKVVRKLHLPVLVIKNAMESVDFSKVVFASTFHESEKEVFLKFKDFVKHFVPEIHLVEVHTSSLMDPPYILSKEAMASFKELCAPFTCKTYVYKDYNIDKGIRSFAEGIGAQLIGISNHHRRPLKRMLSGSNVEALVNHSEIPVLSIDYTRK